MPSSFAALAAVVLVAASTFSQSVVPTGFRDEAVVSGLGLLTALAFLPDGRVLCCEKDTGAIKVVLPDGTKATTGAVPALNSGGFHRGLQGIAVDPQWPARPYVYVWYTSTSPLQKMRLAMHTMTGDLSNPASTNLVLGSQYVILNSVPDVDEFHNGGTVTFGPDGKLWVFTGEDNSPCLASNLSSLAGKILRLDVSALPQPGSGPPATAAITPAGNPWSSLVWARGFRNPFRADIDPVSGTVFVCDVGENLWEEVDVCTAGGNYGWPFREGIHAHPNACGTPPPNAILPVIEHHHLLAPYWSAAIVSLAVYRNPPGTAPHAFGAAYEGDYFYGDHVDGKIRRLRQTGGVWVPPPPEPGEPEPGVWALVTPMTLTDGAVGPDGALYYTSLGGEIRRIRGGAPAGPTLAGSVPCETTIATSPGAPVAFTLTATAPAGPGASVTLTAAGVPAGATIVPPLPASGPSVQIAFNWTPGFAEATRWDLLFTATDQNGAVRTCGLKVLVADALFVGSVADSPPIPVSVGGGVDFLLVDMTTTAFFPMTLDWPPVFGVPNLPGILGMHLFAQVGRYNPVFDPVDPLKLSNGVNITVGDEMTAYGPSSGLTLLAHPSYRPFLGGYTTVLVTEP